MSQLLDQPNENRLDPLEDLLDDLFVNRQTELGILTRNWVANIPRRPGNSYALIGRRRTGKTSILVKLFNQLFYEQDRVIPVYISFASFMTMQRPPTMQEVGEHYLASYLLSFLAFRNRRPEWLRSMKTMPKVHQVVEQLADQSMDPLTGLIVNDLLQNFNFAAQPTGRSDGGVELAINAPRNVAHQYRLPTAVMIDEFQVLTKVYNPTYDRFDNVTQQFQWAVDTRSAPVLVSGSAVSMLVHRALTGALQGRFNYHFLKPLSHEHTYELVFRIGEKSNIGVSEEMAEVIWQVTGGYPYTVQTIMFSDCPARDQFPLLDAVEEVVLFEIGNPHGGLWQHYNEEVEKYSHELNDGTTTRRVMFWTTKYPGQRIDSEQVAKAIGVDEKAVRESLEKLRWIDVVEKVGLISYKGPTDPMLRRFIEYQHYTEIEKLGEEQVIQSWQEEIRQIRGRLSRALGEIGELYARMVMASFDGRTVDGSIYFNTPAPVLLPKFDRIERRGGIVQAGDAVEIDVLAEWRVQALPTPIFGIWLVEAKYTKEPIDAAAVRHFLAQVERVNAQARYAEIVRWFFSKAGFTQPATQLLQEAGVLYSDWNGFLAFSGALGFFGLPTHRG